MFGKHPAEVRCPSRHISSGVPGIILSQGLLTHSLMWRLLATFNFFSAVKLLFFPFPTLLTGRRSLTQTTLTGGMLGCTLGKDEHQRTYGHRLKPQESLINILGDTLSLCNDLLVPKSPLR